MAVQLAPSVQAPAAPHLTTTTLATVAHVCRLRSIVVCLFATPNLISNFFPQLPHSVQEEKFGNGLGSGLWVYKRRAPHGTAAKWPLAQTVALHT